MKILLLIFSLFLASCSEKTDVKVIEKKDTTKKTEIQKDSIKKNTTSNIPTSDLETITKTFKTSTGKTFNITEKKKSASISDYEITGNGFKETSVLKFSDKDPMTNAFTADLNDDGFDELYIITHSAGSGSYGNILGVASINDNSYRIIQVAEIRDKQLSQSGTFSGYMGRDSIYVTYESIVREFPVYLETDEMNNPTGGKRMVVYGLKFNQGAYDLAVINSFYMKKGK